jgi:hypothetical protein
MWFFVKWLPRTLCRTPPLQYSRLGDLVGRPDPRFEELSQPTAIYWIIFELNPFKFKFELWVHKLHFRKFGEKYLEVPWRCGTLKPITNLGSTPTNQKWRVPRVWPRFEIQPNVIQKIQKMENLCMESWYVIWYLAKIPHMAFQGFIEKLFTKNGTKQDSTRLSTQLS